MKSYILLANVLMLAWFIALQYYRFTPDGRACSGDFEDKMELPADFGEVYLSTWGTFIKVYVIGHYLAILLALCITMRINNKHKHEFEKKKALMFNQV